jgi:hypothetical protein
MPDTPLPTSYQTKSGGSDFSGPATEALIAPDR